MLFYFYLVSLLLAIVTFNYYIASGVKTGIHRLLPITFVEITLNAICQLAILRVGPAEIFLIMDDLLMLQIVYLLTHYIGEFYEMRLPKKWEITITVSVVLVGILACMQFRYPMLYSVIYPNYLAVYILLLLGAATYTLRVNFFSKNEKLVVAMLYCAMVATGITVMLRKASFWPGYEVMTLVYDVVCIGAMYLMHTGKLIDNVSLMQRNLFDTSEVAMVLFDAEFYFLEANRVARERFPEDLGTGKRKAKRQQFREGMMHFAAGDSNVSEFEDGGEYFRCVLDEFVKHGERIGYILSIVDITEEKQEVQKMAQMKQEADDQNVLKSKFLANLSHDLRSPLHAVIGASDVLISKNNMSAMNRSYVQMIRNSSRVLLDLVNEILLYSKLEAGKLVLAKNPYSLEGMVKDLSQMMILNLNGKPVNYTLAFDTMYPGEVIGDQIRVREILQNILGNAVKFTEEGQIVCKISCEPEMEQGRVKVICEISDTGPGMSKEQIAKIFDEYASFANLRKKEGTGLGMSIVRQLTQLMGGSTKAQSDGKTGSTITVSFYQGIEKDTWCQPVQYSGQDLVKRTVRIEHGDEPSVNFMDAKVLVVDDLEVNLQVFKQIVARWGIEPDTALSGAEAIELVKENRYQLIFLDLMMPEMDGIETATELKKICDTPLVLLTADASDETKRRSIEAGFADYMSKPIENQRLEANLEKLIPSEFRVAVKKGGAINEVVQSEQSLLAHRSILETVVNELQQLQKTLPEYQKSDMAMFRIKVHGIKGFTRQINRLALSKQAEIMEMAAKTDNQRYIDENMVDFLLEIKETIDEITEELATLPKREVKQSKESIEELLEKLKEAFDEYDLMTAEQCVEQMKTRDLTEEESALLEHLKLACEEIDYDMGSELLAEYLQKT